jgi:pimeloyl-ACP methyl ester carboxylesterase
VSEWGKSTNPLIVMLHGWGDAGATFQFVVDKLNHDWFVIAPDWRGFGDTIGRGESYWFPDYIADLDALLKIYSPDAATNLLGHSMGGNIAGLYAGIFPGRVAKLINIEGFGLENRNPEDAPENYRSWIEQGRSGAAYRRYESFDALAARRSRTQVAQSNTVPAQRSGGLLATSDSRGIGCCRRGQPVSPGCRVLAGDRRNSTAICVCGCGHHRESRSHGTFRATCHAGECS